MAKDKIYKSNESEVIAPIVILSGTDFAFINRVDIIRSKYSNNNCSALV